jgi:hypothetical protein
MDFAGAGPTPAWAWAGALTVPPLITKRPKNSAAEACRNQGQRRLVGGGL